MTDISDTIAWDTETALIDAGLLAPPLSCVTWCDSTLVPQLIHWKDSFEFLRDMLLHKNMVLQHGAYDMAVVAAQFPPLLPLIFQAYEESRVHDTRLQQRLLDLSQGELDGYRDGRGIYHKRTYSLSALSELYGYGPLEKDTYRLTYGTLREIPVADWPQGAIDYAKLDALRTFEVYVKQLERSEFLVNGAAQARAAFALHLQSCHGMITDESACRTFIAQTEREIEKAKVTLQEAGLVDKNGKRELKVARDYMVQVCNSLAIEIPETEKGAVCLDAEACRDTGDDVLKAYSTYTSANTLIKKAQILLKGSQGIPLQTSYETLLETGRTSSRAPMAPMVGDNLQNLRTAEGMRECFVPRPGFVFCSIDFDMAELRTVAQICIWLFGYSKLAEALNADKDVHSMLGANLLGCSYEEMVANKEHGEYLIARKHGKMGNFMLWGAGGVETFVNTVNRSAKKKEDRIDTTTGLRIKSAWKDTWTETTDYFKWTSRMVEQGAKYSSWVTGRVRANLSFPQWANNGFQALASDAAKEGLLPLAKECYVDCGTPLYGSRNVLFTHDENLFELVESRQHDAAFRARDIMVEHFNTKYTPDVKVTATPTLMRALSKYAKTVYDANGRLIPWMPEKKEAA